MNIEVILVFIVIAVLSGLSNRNKNQQQKRKRQNRQPPSQPMESRKTSQKQPQRTTPKRKSLLEEMMEQYDLADPRNKQDARTTKKPERKIKPEEPVEEKKKTDPKKKITSSLEHKEKKSISSSIKRKSKEKKIDDKGIYGTELTKDLIDATSVEKSEIGQKAFSSLVEVDQQSLVKGIIMAEVLGKPKSRRRKDAS